MMTNEMLTKLALNEPSLSAALITLMVFGAAVRVLLAVVVVLLVEVVLDL